jgi:hypothetical protein
VSEKRYVCEVLMGGESEVFKRYGKDEETVSIELQKFLRESYGHIFQIQSVKTDKTKTVKD